MRLDILPPARVDSIRGVAISDDLKRTLCVLSAGRREHLSYFL